MLHYQIISGQPLADFKPKSRSSLVKNDRTFVGGVNNRQIPFFCHHACAVRVEICYASALAGEIEELPDCVRCENICLQNNTKMSYKINYYEELP
jgi:hypothetical protein